MQRKLPPCSDVHYLSFACKWMCDNLGHMVNLFGKLVVGINLNSGFGKSTLRVECQNSQWWLVKWSSYVGEIKRWVGGCTHF